MAETIRVRLKKGVVEAEVLEVRPRTLLVRLPDGNVIVRKKSRDIVA